MIFCQNLRCVITQNFAKIDNPLPNYGQKRRGRGLKLLLLLIQALKGVTRGFVTVEELCKFSLVFGFCVAEVVVGMCLKLLAAGTQGQLSFVAQV